ncbi:hypothetical protein VCR14J2_390372 [Vibrio coralliirubri]|uniref:hypothetical protein n=1 Tax=Vibrio coralliirubri TaxID=1516159 RepID=UPI00062F28E5|nr:hypothetical protein [Vibrio coralliirubri]CDU05756.1 hypothetical protein VCR14J2_390372 [Vibrio coralliirubri]
MSTIVDLEIHAGADYRHDFYVYESDDTSEPRDLSGDDIEATFRSDDANGRELFTLTLGDGLTFVDPEGGQIRMTVKRELTESLRFRDVEISGTYDIELTDVSGFPRSRIVQGSHLISRDNTRGNNGE